MRRIISRAKPAPEPEPAPKGRLQQALELPQLVPIRLFWDNFHELRPWWPVLVPLLLLSARRAYRRERALVLAARAKQVPETTKPARRRFLRRRQ